MLQELSIRNFAIIDDLRIRFSRGLTILSGETGAGKSIIINAVNLILGSRASAKLIRSGEETAELEALFSISKGCRAAAAMKAHGYDPEEGLLIRRMVSRNDRHRIYINGRLATVQILSEITENLASISGQHAHQGLLKEDQHLLILDQFGGLMPEREQVGKRYHELVPLIQRLQSLEKKRKQQKDQMALLQFQRDEILDAAFSEGEDLELEAERKRLKNAEMLSQSVYGCVEALYGATGSVFETLGDVKRQLEKAGGVDPQLSENAASVSETLFQVEDVVDRLRGYLGSLEMDDARLEEVEARLSELNRLKRKYGGTLEAVRAHLEGIEQELEIVGNIDDEIDKTKASITTLREDLIRHTTALSHERSAAVADLSKKVEKELASLKMAPAKYTVLLEKLAPAQATDPHLMLDGNALSDTGMDHAVFMIAPNLGEAMKPLAAIASGGELSRVVLALKAILAKSDAVETVVFDEVDAGIGGGVAEVVGKKLKELSGHHQIICITHLPQIAKFGDQHFKISKSVQKGRTTTAITAIEEDERVMEIARMLGGMTITDATLDHARELLDS